MKGIRFLFKFSYRNLLRSPKRTLILILSLSIGTGFIIWDLNFANSGSKEVMKEFLTQYAGEYHITHKDYYHQQNKKEFNNFKIMTDNEIEDKKLISSSTRRVTAPIFVSGQKKTLGVLLTGLETEKELKLSTLARAVTVGRFLHSQAENEIVLGKKLAFRIEVNIGDQVAVIGQALDGSVANELMTVVGLIDFGGGDLEESLAFTQIKTAQDFLVMTPDQYHQRVDFNMKDESIPKLKDLAVTAWTDLLPEIGVSVKFVDNFTWLVSIIIVMVISLGLSNSLMITFLEREQEFICLNIIGAKAIWVTISLLIEVMLLGTIAIIFGTILGHLSTNYFHHYPFNIQVFTGGKPIIMGGMIIQPLVRIYPVLEFYWKVPVMIYIFLLTTMIYPLIRVIRRSKNAI